MSDLWLPKGLLPGEHCEDELTPIPEDVMQAGDGVRGFAGPAGVRQAAEQIEQFTEERGKMT